MSLEDQEKTKSLAAFMHQLISSGMSLEETVKMGFNYAMEASAIRHGRPVASKTEQMELAAKRLEAAAKQVGIHFDQQRAAMEKKG